MDVDSHFEATCEAGSQTSSSVLPLQGVLPGGVSARTSPLCIVSQPENVRLQLSRSFQPCQGLHSGPQIEGYTLSGIYA